MKKLAAFAAVLFSVFSTFALPDGFSKIHLGMSLDELKSELKKDLQFCYRGDRDVSLSPSDGQILIETDASGADYSFLDRCYFQFADEKLYIITINMKNSKIDHYSIFSKLCEKYGQPKELNPNKSLWQDSSVIMTLERPLTLKYVDAKSFKDKKDKSNIEKTTGEKARDAFLDSL
ncbi:MAG: hypothetical protein KBT11_01740 [Treponema sp.]|nr:hypothetical protein [Candidatus Treponema equifaecale]